MSPNPNTSPRPPEDVLEAREHRRVEAARRDADALVPVAVVGRPLLRVGEHRIGLRRFLELLLASLLPGFRSGWYFSASFR